MPAEGKTGKPVRRAGLDRDSGLVTFEQKLQVVTFRLFDRITCGIDWTPGEVVSYDMGAELGLVHFS